MLMTMVVTQNIKTYERHAAISYGAAKEVLNLEHESTDDAIFTDAIKRTQKPVVACVLNGSLIEVYQLHAVEN